MTPISPPNADVPGHGAADGAAATTAARPAWICFSQCRGCGHRQVFARRFCLSCLSPDLQLCPAAGPAVAVAVTTITRAPDPDWAARAPYSIALADLAEGLRVMALCDPGIEPGEALQLAPGGRHGLPFFHRSDSPAPVAPSSSRTS